jgi:hypothetical protein
MQGYDTRSGWGNGLLIVLIIGICTIIPTAGAQVLLVAASDAPPLATVRADFVCDGIEDQEEINAALSALPAGGGLVILSEGTFHCTGPADIILPAHTTLEGSGDETTEILYTNSLCYPWKLQFWGCLRLNQPDTAVRNLRMDGTGWIYISESRVTVENVTVSTKGAPPHTVQAAFHVRADGKVVEDITFRNCTAIDCHGFGFMNDADETRSPRLIRSITYLDCQAIDCGRYERYSDWDVGFDIVENNDIEDCELIRCRAEGCWESGFHIEGSDAFYARDIRFTDCISRNNGQKPDAQWGAGFLTPWHTRFENCTSVGNDVGFYLNGNIYRPGVNITLIRCVDEGSGIGFSLRSCSGTPLIDCASINATGLGIEVLGSYDSDLVNFTLTDPSGDGTKCSYFGRDVGPRMKLSTRSCDLEIRASGGDSDSLIYLESVQDIYLTGTLLTDCPHPIVITDAPVLSLGDCISVPYRWADGVLEEIGDLCTIIGQICNRIMFSWMSPGFMDTGTRTIVIDRMLIVTRSEATTGAAITIEDDVAEAGTISITDCIIRGGALSNSSRYAIENLAREKVRIENVTVSGAETGCIGCAGTVVSS